MENNNLEDCSISELFDMVQTTASQLEKPDIELEDAFAKYEEGIKAVKVLSGKLENVKARVSVITEDGELKNFLEE